MGLVLPDGGGRVVRASHLGGSVSADFPGNLDVPLDVGQRAREVGKGVGPLFEATDGMIPSLHASARTQTSRHKRATRDIMVAILDGGVTSGFRCLSS